MEDVVSLRSLLRRLVRVNVYARQRGRINLNESNVPLALSNIDESRENMSTSSSPTFVTVSDETP